MERFENLNKNKTLKWLHLMIKRIEPIVISTSFEAVCPIKYWDNIYVLTIHYLTGSVENPFQKSEMNSTFCIFTKLILPPTFLINIPKRLFPLVLVLQQIPFREETPRSCALKLCGTKGIYRCTLSWKKSEYLSDIIQSQICMRCKFRWSQDQRQFITCFIMQSTNYFY